MTAHAAIKNTFFEDFFVQKSLTIIAAVRKKMIGAMTVTVETVRIMKETAGGNRRKVKTGKY